MLTFDQAIDLAHKPSGMDASEARELLDALMSGAFTAEQAAKVLVDLAERGETSIELAAFVQGLLERAVKLDGATRCMDICGTGGSGLTRFNVSTTVAFILAAAGIPIAKHGNRGSQRPNGSFDLLEKLAVNYQLPPERLLAMQRDTGLCFLFARSMHPGMAALAPARKLAGRRTIFNLAGPLANPARPVRQVIGVISEKTAQVVAGALQRLGCERAVVVWGDPGIDEFSVVGPSHFLLIDRTAMRRGSFAAKHPNLCHEELPGGDASDNVAIFERLISCEERGPLADMVLLNAGVAIDLWHGRPIEPNGAGMREAQDLVSSGAARACFERHRDKAKQVIAGGRTIT